MRKGGWAFPNYKRFETFGQALRWAKEMRASQQIQGFRLVEIRKDSLPQIKHLNIQPSSSARSEYRCEGSTDAEILGMRY